jgi:hypothetical protein
LLNVTGELDAAKAVIAITEPASDIRSVFMQSSFGAPGLQAMIGEAGLRRKRACVGYADRAPTT